MHTWIHRWIRRQGAIFGVLILLGALGVVTAPSAAANDIWGVAESSASWTNPATGTVHTFHWRFAVEREAHAPPALDRFRYRARTWCDYRQPGNPYATAERCNFNMYDSALQIKNCLPNQSCLIREPWGRANWEIDGVTEKLWLGTWHDDRFDAQSYRSITLRMQARFLIPNHLTQTYVGCSRWVQYNGASSAQQTCQGA
jgi:hypothetical protein